MIVGITGGIGAGKSTASEIFAFLGVPIYEADFHSKNLLDTDKELQSSLMELLGTDISKNGLIDRAKMASIIFSNNDLLEKANALIHPKVANHFKEWLSLQDFPYIIKEAAILFESGSYKNCDQVIVVTAPKDLRITRVMARSGISREEILARMDKQWPEEKKLELANFIIQNDGNASLIKQVLKIHKSLLNN